MGLYAVLDSNGYPIAYHESRRVIFEFCEKINRDYPDKDCISVKVKHPKRIYNSQAYVDNYLVKVGRSYVPARLYDEASVFHDEEKYNYEEVVNLISRELEFSDLSSKEIKSLESTLTYFQKKLNNPSEIDLRSLEHLKEMKEGLQDSYYKE